MVGAEELRETVLEAARQVLAERGYRAELVEIAQRAGVGVATIYRRWESREALIREVVLEMIHEAQKQLVQILQDHLDARDAILQANRVGFLMVKKYGELATVTVAGTMPSAYRDVFPFWTLDAFFRHLIRAGIAQGHFREEIDVHYAARAWKSLVAPEPVRGMMPESSPEELAQLTSEFLLAALSGK